LPTSLAWLAEPAAIIADFALATLQPFVPDPD